jgi:hypothetical protein
MKYRMAVILPLIFTINTAVADDFVSYESGICQFRLQGYELTPPVERAIVFGASKILEAYKDMFEFPFPDNFKVKIVIFSDKELFKKYQKNQINSIISETGYFSPMHQETVVLQEKNTKKTEDAKKMVSVAFHEASHMILMNQVPWCPAWANEGLAEYFEGLNVFGENRRVYLEENRAKWCKLWAKKGFPIELEKYLNLSYEEWTSFKAKDANAAYTIGYSVIYFMMSSKSTEKVLGKLLWEFKKDGRNVDSVKVINDNYPGGLAKLKQQWLKWIPKARPYRPLAVLRERPEEAEEDSSSNSQQSNQQGN